MSNPDKRPNLFVSALPALFLLAAAGTGYLVSQHESEPHHTTITVTPPSASPSPSPTPTKTRAKPTASPLPADSLKICGEIFKITPVTSAMQEEVHRIRKDYPYVCDVDWDLMEGENWGLAWTPGATVEINSEFEYFRIYTSDTADNLEFQVKETVRHEFGHQVTFQHFGMPQQHDADILEIFGDYRPDPIVGEILPTYNADEHAADIFAAALNPDPESPYVTRYSKEILNTARYYLDNTTAIH